MTNYKKILNIALPAMAENFLQMLMGVVDSYLVASLGLVAISGVSVAGNIISIYQAIFIALGVAVSSLISKSLGEGDRDNLAYHTSEAIKLTMLVSMFLGFLSLVFGRRILAWLGTEPAVANAGGLYLALIGGMILLLGLMTTLGSLIRATSNPRMPMYVSFLSNLLNVLFSSLAIFIFPFMSIDKLLNICFLRPIKNSLSTIHELNVSIFLLQTLTSKTVHLFSI